MMTTACSLASGITLVVTEPHPLEPPTPRELELRAAMRAYQAGDTAAFEQLWVELKPRLYRHFVAHTRDGALADDLVQETFLRLHQARRSYDPELALEPWLFAIARYVLLMHRRARGRRAKHEEPMAENTPLPGDASPGDKAHDRQLLAELLPKVPATGRKPLLLHHLFGFDFQEIARRLGISPGAARVRASRAMSELKRQAGSEPREKQKP